MARARYLNYRVPKSRHGYDFIQPWMKCDTTSLYGPMTEFGKQMRQAGDSVYWSGAIVLNKPEIMDPLNAQLKVPPIKADPYPVKLPRPFNNPNGVKAQDDRC